MAMENNIYGTPNCRMPNTAIMIHGWASKVIDETMVGRPIKNVNRLPSKIDSLGDAFFCFLNRIVNIANETPATTAHIFPKNPSGDNSSKKNNTNPVNIMTMVSQSTFDDFSPKK